MASQGIRATMAYSPSALCAPSRASIFQERHLGIVNCIRGNRKSETNELDQQQGVPNFVQELQTAGYDTAYYGKWGLGVVQGGPWYVCIISCCMNLWELRISARVNRKLVSREDNKRKSFHKWHWN
jgi:arylsulfatase A-like enzyme